MQRAHVPAPFWVCARRSIAPRRARMQRRGRPISEKALVILECNAAWRRLRTELSPWTTPVQPPGRPGSAFPCSADAMRSSHLRSTRANHSTTSWSTQPTLNPKALRLLRISSAQPPVGSKDLDHHERHIIVRDWGIASGPKTLSGG